MSAQWLAQLPGSVLAIAGGVHIASHEAGRLADTKHPGWRPVGKSRSGQLASAKQSAQQLASCPATHPRSIRLNYRATPENQPSSVRATSCVASRESSTQYQMNHQGACARQLSSGVRATSRQCPRNSHASVRLASMQRPQTRSVHVRVQSVNRPWPQLVRDHVQSECLASPRPILSRDKSANQL